MIPIMWAALAGAGLIAFGHGLNLLTRPAADRARREVGE